MEDQVSQGDDGGIGGGSMALKGAVNPGSVAFSANGKYMALAAEGAIWMVETETGKALGSVAFAGAGETGAFKPTAALAFSPSGKELAAVMVEGGMGAPKKLHVMMIGVATGQVAAEKVMESTLASLSGPEMGGVPRLMWNPEGTRLLLDCVVIDRGSLTGVFEFPKPGIGNADWWRSGGWIRGRC